MRGSLCAVVLALLIAAPPVRAQATDSSASHASAASAPKQRDSFIGLDKPKHFLLSFFIESGAFAALEASGAGRRSAGIGAFAATAAIGIGREVHDGRTKGLFSLGDLFWDALGAGAAALMLRHTYR